MFVHVKIASLLTSAQACDDNALAAFHSDAVAEGLDDVSISRKSRGSHPENTLRCDKSFCHSAIRPNTLSPSTDSSILVLDENAVVPAPC